VSSCGKPACIATAHKLMEAEVYDEVINHTRQRALTYNSYRGMLDRVNNNPQYRHVIVDPRWQGEGGFDRFIEDMRLRPHGGMSLDRINPHENYTKANCRWADNKVQSRNKRTSVVYNVGDQQWSLCDIAAVLGTTSQAVTRRITKLIETGLSRDEAANKVLLDGRKSAQCAA
jgi:biotin operon repressor